MATGVSSDTGASIADHRPVYTSITTEDFAKVAVRAGCQATVKDSGDTRLVALTQGRRKFLAVMDWRVAKQNLYTLVVLQAGLTLTERVSDEAISQVNSRSKFVKVWRTDARTVRLHMRLVLDGGVTSGVARAVAASLDQSWRECERQLRRASAGEERRTSRQAEVIH